ncbi:cyclophilin-like fold protein [Priestia flexa]|uniref:cyclophilin-like fold protein n=1 Tax=Priestia flexa TaxID=86664 RepID=UPI00077C8C6A|nr:cyclophilin-like fold protein [Priestia flexa]MBY6087277.1 hypothetical protein [Priestia flexa]MED4589817.1 cyclophilin-like fold protein [Priestia flexa]WEZ06880.1 cyclophilin-like fold protein [Priestia flexa]SIR25513.1 hypothetical protein SAMN05880580_11570 [Priestia flexa]
MYHKTLLIALILLLGTACSNEVELRNKSKESSTTINEGRSTVEKVRKIKLSVQNEEIIVKMNNSPTSRDFLELLPLTLTFEDYAGKEKVSNPPRQLSKESALSGIEPRTGDVTYYAPWGNLAIFYKDFSYSNGLIKLGEIESGFDHIQNLEGKVKIEVIE